MALLCMGHFLFGKQVPVDETRRAGINFYFERINQYRSVDYSAIGIKETFTMGGKVDPVYYIFNLVPAGWVIVSADDAVVPVLAYSFEGNYQETDMAPQFRAWMKQYEDQISYAREQKNAPFESIKKAWDHLLVNNPSSLIPFKNQREVLPLIISKWNQNTYYNEYCPIAAGGPGGHAYAGCVPTCMGQIMYYYRWPDTGIGSYSYEDPNFGALSADFGNTTYRWNEMVDALTGSDPAIAELLFHLGVSCDLQYGANGSGMYNHKAAYSLRTFFKYSPQTQYVFRDSTAMNWDSILIAHLDRKMPLYYAGWSVPNVNGHAFVCDGYQDTSYFHFNFGWSGSSDGYFYTDNLTPGGSNFNLAQEVIINCYPDTVNYTYPSYCEGGSDLTFRMGSIDDGSGPMKNYLANKDCSWLIDPQTPEDSITDITLKFDCFNTDTNDIVNIYDGPTAASPLLGSFSGQILPPQITSTGNKMLITFTTLNGPPEMGWFANYTTIAPVWCSGTTILTADTAELTDGSMTFNYHNNTNCRWRITPENGLPVTIYFRSFDTEPGKDVLRIFDLQSQDTLAEISGHYSEGSLPDSVTAPSGKMYLIFTSNSSITAKGWEIYYPASHVGITEPGFIRSLSLYPNPVSDKVTISFSVQNSGLISYTLSDLQSRIVAEGKIEAQQGENSTMVDVSKLQAGTYFIRFHDDQSVITRKLQIIHTRL